MKYRHLSVVLITLLVLLFSGCVCSHEWTQANCEDPQICTKCQEVGSPALGHQWLDATCTDAQVCSRCGAAQGEPLGHSYGQWELGEEQMSHTCAVCSHVETAQIDREIYLASLLPGYWDFFGMYDDSGYIEAGKLELVGAEFYFAADRTAIFRMPQLGTQQVTWSFDSYAQENGADSYYFTLKGETETYSMCLRHDPTGQLNQPEKQLVLLSSQLLLFGQYDMNKILVHDWGITNDQWGNIQGNPGNWFTFRDDRTVIGNLNGAVDGIWHVIPVYSTGLWHTPSDYIILIENNAGAGPEVITATLYTSSGNGLRIRVGNVYQTFGRFSEKALEQVKIANEIHLGTWTSTEVEYQGETERKTSDYSVTFNADGTFTANLGKELHGSWMLRNIVDAKDKDWTNGNENPTYMYYMFADGLKDKIYCEVTGWSDRDHFIIHNFELMDGRRLEFVKYSDEEHNLMMQRNTYLLGTWPASYYYVENTAENTRTEDEHPEDHYFTFHEDGTFTAQLEEEMGGAWEFADLHFMETSLGDYWELDYLLTFDGQSESIRIHVELTEDAYFWIRVPLPEKDGFEIDGCFPTAVIITKS